ncbi:crotonase/enoyl-CoA hydratase family protein [Seongchinamella sediminis]|uniref:Crotonase/enoyl-CoA hydratase family protein n=1 Tax=Seongchinamella sediminis TaxID=2283635 RepID=A0A3L7E2M4_9GAMM|nr:crotonase/enoyl-CoA hydratase family protein [Seongchinamella sediminis]RLQ23806.1 crotonase/enoyl-CoA hydratase family protein [Seongchinamella sediminis]
MSVSVEQQGRVTVITLQRPEVRNAVDGVTARALAQAFTDFDQDDGSDVAVFHGANGTFCAGADLKALAAQAGSNPLSEQGDGPMGPSRMLLGKPVIAAVSGHAVAGGLELALWCDLRVVEETAVLGVFCRRWGVPLIDGGTVRLPRLIGHSRALDLILSGRPVAAQEALAMGLANRVVAEGEALAAALKLARQLCAFPQNCLRSDRLSAYRQWDMDFEAAMNNEFRQGMAVIASQETVTGARRFAAGAGRHGDFKDLGD